MPPHRPERPPDQPAPTAAGFDAVFSAVPASPGLKRAWQLAIPELPPGIEPFSFVSLGLLRHVAHALNLAPGQTLVDLGCGGDGPGLWLARTTNVSLVGVDFSPVAVEQATQRAALFGLAGRARFVVGDLTDTGLPGHSADAAVSVDAFHFAADPPAAAAHARQLLRPGARLVLTNWQPRHPGDRRLPARARIDWPPLLRAAGFTDIDMAEQPGWHALWTRVYQVALDLGDPGDDTAPADLQDEARRRLPLTGLSRRVVVTATSGRLPKPPATETEGNNREMTAPPGIGCASLDRSWGETG